MNSTSLESRKRDHSKGAKGEASIYQEAGRLKINLPRQYFGGQQVKRALGLQATPENWAKAERIARRITLDLQDGCFDETLVKYGVKSNIKILPNADSLPPKPKLSILEIWEKYLEYKKPIIKETHFFNVFISTYTSAIKKAIEAVGEDSMAIRNWLLANRCSEVAVKVLKNLDQSYRLFMKQGLITTNPFDGMIEDLPKADKNQRINTYDPAEDESNSLYDHQQIKKKAFTKNEVEIILEAVKQTKGKHYYPIIRFLFLAGCRTNEATGLMWGDVKWDKEYIVIQRSYSPQLKKFVSTKTRHIRLFPMPKNGELWILLKSLSEGSPHELVFKGKKGKAINSILLSIFWKGTTYRKNGDSPGLIPTLVSQGRVSKYLPLYNTRHTFISYQINECGVPPHVVKDWCGHSEDMTTKTYRQEDLLTKPVDYNNESISKQQSEPSRLEVLEQQVQLLMEQNKMLQEIIVGLETKSKDSNPSIVVEPIT